MAFEFAYILGASVTASSDVATALVSANNA
jgi:hypothetical protein